MKTSKSLWHFVALTLVVSAFFPAMTFAHPGTSLLLLQTAVTQADGSRVVSGRQEAEQLMVRARQALKQGDLDTAESLTQAVEQMRVSYGIFHFGDTPRKLRADVQAAQRKSAKQPQRPSQKFTPQVAQTRRTAPAPTGNPSAGRIASHGPQRIETPQQEPRMQVPQAEGRIKPILAPLTTPATPEQEAHAVPGKLQPVAGARKLTPPADPAARQKSDALLLGARRALAVGDVRRAAAAVEAAQQLNVEYGYHDDTPDRVQDSIVSYRQASQLMEQRQDAAARRQFADVLLDQAEHLVRWKEYDEAERLVHHVKGLNVNYSPFDVQPETLLERIASARRGGPQPPNDAGAEATAAAMPAGEKPAGEPFPVGQAVYDEGDQAPQARQTNAQEELPLEGAEPIPQGGNAMQLYGLGEQALRARDTKRALELFRRAYELRDQLDPTVAQRLQDHLQLLSAPPKATRGVEPQLLDDAASEQQLLVRQVSNDLAKQELAASKIQQKEPRRSMEILKEARAAVEASTIEAEAKGVLLRRVDRKINELDQYIVEHRIQIEQDEKNRQVLEEVDRRLQAKVEVDEKLAKLVDDFNRYMDEERFAEAEVLAKRARELAPDNPIVKQLIWQSKFVKRTQRNRAIGDAKESGYWAAMTSVEQSAEPFDDNNPYRFGDAKKWEDLTKSRGEMMSERKSRRSERELEIEAKLRTPVSLKFRERPLSEVLEHLATLAAVNLYVDPLGLEDEGVGSDTPVTIDLTQEITLKSALTLILEPLHLSYVIQNEVLKVTSEQLCDGVTDARIYDVADLVIPIPNFTPNGRFGLQGAIAEAYNMTGTGVGLSPGSAFVAGHDGSSASGLMSPEMQAQIAQLMPGDGRMASGMNQPIGMGPGGMGGGAQADFDSLIELITTTVKPQTWDEVGGPGSISPFENNLSLVINQTEDVHEEIVDLLEQLRRNQDLQVTIEVRFITLSDTFFERIGVDFDFNIINTSATVDPDPLVPPRNKREIVGLTPTGGFTQDLGIPFTQESFALAVPQFGTPVPVSQFGFAILSDLEAFLLVEAAQGDRRSNVLQAPKVTLFNGQQASVFDQTAMPFVISVIPVVGDFAAAYQPVITVLSEGTALTVQAVISHDRRFVRLTVLPLFSQIGDVTEFTFSGSSTTSEAAAASESTGGEAGDSEAIAEEVTLTNDGVTVQLPNFSFVSVVTTVSVPDGGTVLLGGIKRLSEGRNEFGVPLLSKLPYLNRLFKNVGIGRETQSLMMMVTPRIIIQEEEEERLGIQLPSS
ncbi:MAG: general secretion pathway protein GspD [Planctomycetota bacterium]|nr:MAG: general secretion pathway protein GspD [Planctomycetota bacterium]